MMVKKKTKLQISLEQTEYALNVTNTTIEELGGHTERLCAMLSELQALFDAIRNIPSDMWPQYKNLKEIRMSWKEQAEKIREEYNNATLKIAGQSASGVCAGVAVAALGPTAAMGIATTFGVASTGTAISTLSGAAATNAALAWLGGGALAAGGGGMTAGSALLALAGPMGCLIASMALLASGYLFWKTRDENKRLGDVFTLISERDKKSYELAIVELKERVVRICNETSMLSMAIDNTKLYGLDYEIMTEAQQYELGSYVNLMSSSTQLLVNPILGLQPKYREVDYDAYCCFSKKAPEVLCRIKDPVMALANLLYKIELDEKDKILLWKLFRNDEIFLASMGIEKKFFDYSILDTACDALKRKQVFDESVNKQGEIIVRFS